MSHHSVPPPIPAELPDWILALKPPDADVASPEESAVFAGLDAELERLTRAKPDELAWLAQAAEQSFKLTSRNEAAAILDGEVRPQISPRPVRKRHPRKWRQSDWVFVVIAALQLIVLIAAVVLLLLATQMGSVRHAPPRLGGWRESLWPLGLLGLILLVVFGILIRQSNRQTLRDNTVTSLGKLASAPAQQERPAGTHRGRFPALPVLLAIALLVHAIACWVLTSGR